jgi:hypothetical protein
MQYIFEVNIATDGDFCFPYVPCGMTYDGDERYSLTKSYVNQIDAIRDITKICEFLKEHIDTSRDWVEEMFISRINNFLRNLQNEEITHDTYIYECLSGNYDGTDFTFRVQPYQYNFCLNLSDEEFELIHKSGKMVTRSQIKDAVLALFK